MFYLQPEYGVDKKNHNDTPAAAQQTVQAHPPSKVCNDLKHPKYFM